MLHSGGSESTQAATALVQLLRDLGYDGQAERVLAEAFPDGEAEGIIRAAQAISGRPGWRPDALDLTARGEAPATRSTIDAESLWSRLQHEPELRTHLRRVGQGASTDDSRDLVVAVATATAAAVGALGSAMAVSPVAVVVAASSVLPVLARVLATWLRTRRSDVTVTLTAPDGRQVSLDAKRVNDPENLLRQVLEERET